MAERALKAVDFKAPQRVIAVLGMHRSGTSWLTGTLQEAGLSLGDCHTWNKHNEKGNRENQQFVDLHDAILAANSAAWDNPPTKVVWGSEHVAEARRLLEAHAGEPTFGFKDPRALLVLDGWKQLEPIQTSIDEAKLWWFKPCGSSLRVIWESDDVLELLL